MKPLYFYEIEQRGTPDFPIEFYHVNKNHPRYHMRAQWHKDIEIERVLKGYLIVQLGDQTVELRQNQSILIPGGIIHSAEPSDCVYECVVFSPTVLSSTAFTNIEVKRKLNKPVVFEKNDHINSFFEYLKNKPFEDYEFKVISHLYAIIFHAIKEQKNIIPITNAYRLEQIKPAINYIEENFKDKILLDELSSSCSMSPNYFCKFFKEFMHLDYNYIFFFIPLE